MPITAFSNADDGLEPERRRRGHFVADTNLNDDGPWVPYAEGAWFQPCCFNVTSGGFSLVLKGLPGAKLGVHYHVGTVQGYTMRGRWRYLEHDWIAGPGTFIYEPAGEAHTLVIMDDSPEPALIFFAIEGALVYLDRPVSGAFLAYEDAFSALELTRKHYREAGLDARRLDVLIRQRIEAFDGNDLSPGRYARIYFYETFAATQSKRSLRCRNCGKPMTPGATRISDGIDVWHPDCPTVQSGKGSGQPLQA